MRAIRRPPPAPITSPTPFWAIIRDTAPVALPPVPLMSASRCLMGLKLAPIPPPVPAMTTVSYRTCPQASRLSPVGMTKQFRSWPRGRPEPYQMRPPGMNLFSARASLKALNHLTRASPCSASATCQATRLQASSHGSSG